MINSFGKLFKFTTWGESHGTAIGCVIDAVPANIEISAQEIQYFLDQRKPGKQLTSPRAETDQVKILSGVFEGKTTGAPISLIIENIDIKSTDYKEISQMYRPGHADYTYQTKYGIRDFRGGGRSSARETAVRVAAGAIARKIINSAKYRSALINIGGIPINKSNWDWSVVANNSFNCPDKEILPKWKKALEDAQNEGDSLGAIAELHVSGVPVGLGEPIYYKLDAAIAEAVMGINAVKAVEIGDGFNLVNMKGSQANDQMFINQDNKPDFISNHSGGILGGISTGQDIIIRYVVKPTSSIRKKQISIDEFGNNVNISTIGRHDPCVGLRAIYVIEAMVACVLADLFLLNKCRKI